MNEEDIKYAINLIKRCKKRKSGYRERDYEAFDIAIKALKSQVPKRVKYDNIPANIMATADTLEEIREKIPSNMVKMDRHPKDDPCIVEVWI